MRRCRMPQFEEPGGDPRRNVPMQTSADVSTNSGGVYRYTLCCLSSVQVNPDRIMISASGVYQCNLSSAAG
jgi:hypothetical protein